MQAPTRVPAPPVWISEFKAFILRGNVVDLAVGIIIGAAFNGVVSSLVKDVFAPVLGLLAGGVDFTNLFITLKGEHAATLEAAQKAGAVTINVGLFLNAIFSFVIVSCVIFAVVKLLSRFKAKEAEVVAALSKTEETLVEIRDILAHARTTLPT